MSQSRQGTAFGTRPASILLVEDDEGLLDLVQHHLAPANIPTHAVRTGAEALAWLSAQPDALLLLDYSLPDMTAAAMLAELERAGRTIPFVVMTGHGDERIAVEMMKQGARDYLVKDLHFLDRLPGIVDRVLRELRNERGLEASQQRFKAVFEGSEDALMMLNREGFLDCNSRTLTLFGFDDKVSFLNHHPGDLSPPLQPNGEPSVVASMRHIDAALRKGSEQFEWTHRRRNGELFPAEVLLSSFELAGEVLLQATVRDITERKKVEQTLQESRERYRQLVQVSPDAIFVHADGCFIYANPAGCRLLRASNTSELVGRRILDHVHPDYRDDVQRRIQEAVEDGTPAPAKEEVLLRLDGSLVEVEVAATSMAYNGRPAIQVLARDISERKRAERELAANEQRFRHIVGNATAAFFRIDATGRYEQVNEAWLRLHGYQHENDVIGQPMALTLTEESRPVVEQLAQRLLRGETVPPGESSHRCRDGTQGCHAYSLWPVQHGASTTGFEGFLIDTTDLRRARADYQMLFARMIDGFALHKLICDARGKPVDYQFLAINPAFERLTGMRADRVVGRRLSEIMPHEDPYWVNIYGNVVLSGEPAFVEHRSAELNRLFEVSAFRTGHMEFAAVFVDVTEHRKAEEDLKKSREELLSIYEHAPVMMTLLDADGRVRRINRAMSEFTTRTDREADGLRSGELLGCTHSQDDPMGCGFGPACRECGLRLLVQETHETGISHRRVEFKPRLFPSHEFKDVTLLASTARIPIDGRPLVLLCLEDVTRQHQAEERLREQAALLDITQDAILVLELDGRIRFWSRGAERLYGYRRDEASGQSADHLLSERGTLPLMQLRDALLKSKDWSGELRQFNRDRQPLIVQCRASLVHDSCGIPRSMLLVATNVTEQKALEAKFLRAQRLESIGALASGVAHDLNNILSPLLMALPMLRPQLASAEDRATIDMMLNGVRRGSGIVNQLLMFGRGAEGVRSRIKPKAIIEEMTPIIQETFPKSIELATSIAPNLPVIVGDATQLHQVMMNLCVNARDAMASAGGKLRLSASLAEVGEPISRLFKDLKPGPYLLLEVSDTGTGIPPEILERIFDPFFTTKEVGKGTGLGLSTVQGIARSHGGFVDVSSEPGMGTTFRVYLPAAESHAHEVEAHQDAPAAKRGGGELVLVIDDENSLRDVITKLLRANGYKVVHARHGLEGLQIFEQEAAQIRAVIIDMMMPTLDGAATIRQIREKAPELFIVGMSGLPQMEVELRAAAKGFCGFLAKPFATEALLDALDGALH